MFKFKYYNFTTQQFADFDFLKEESSMIEHYKKISDNKEIFKKFLANKIFEKYWAKTQYQTILSIAENGSLCLSVENETYKLYQNGDEDFDWQSFVKDVKLTKRHPKAMVVSIFEQVSYVFNDLADYCWKTTL